ncbi:hypothetical protein P7K49_039538 [Saguinus oedipus]|uniref:Uncharacterized protein n=1 Tax=Saguinus oedipus TaxID=9490 RepID=A0ABQ9TA30_SAGOE|nr:hypothetical protein P7K49_039538 [Saguinus oedipus]
MDTTLVFPSPPVTWACQISRVLCTPKPRSPLRNKVFIPILHHHLQQDGQMGIGQCSQTSSIPQKPQTNKSAYNSYSWGAN